MNLTNKVGLKGQYFIRIKRNGKYIKLWQENWLGNKLFQLFRLQPHIPFILGSYKEQYTTPNLLVTVGLAELAKLAIDTGTPTAFSYIAVGTDDTAAAAGQTALVAEITDSGLARAIGTKSTVQTTVAGDTSQLLKEFSVTGTKAIKEVGVFNATPAGTMLSRSIITTKNVGSGDTIEITYKLVHKNQV